MTSRERFEAYRDARNALLESEGNPPGSKWHVNQAHFATWEAATSVPITLPSASATLPTGDVLAVERANGEHAMLKRCKDALRAAGYEVVT